MTLEQSIVGFCLHVMRRMRELGTVRAACREVGISRTFFYRCCQPFEPYGPEGLRPEWYDARPGPFAGPKRGSTGLSGSRAGEICPGAGQN